MTDHTTETLVGAAVLAVAIGFGIYVTQATGRVTGSSGTYDLSASFRSVEGVGLGTDVRLGGVKIGSVTGLDLNPTTFRAETVLTIDSAYILPEDTAVAIASEGLLGGNFVELMPGGSPFDLEPGSAIENTQSSVSLITLLLRFVTGSEEE